jgi:NAD-dependent DNA ligase
MQILYGEVLVFTGALSMQRHDAAVLAANAGCQVEEGVTKRIDSKKRQEINGLALTR